VNGYNRKDDALSRQGPRDSRMLHGSGPIVYLLGEAQLGVHLENRTAGPTPWTTCLASAA
jgi:hypothetical protein